jgi:hypothetical protein
MPPEGLECSLLNKLRGFGNIHVIIQFHKIPSMQEKVELEKNGVSLLNYIHNNAYFASVPSSEGKLRDIVNMSHIRWIGDILPEDKISEYIRKGQIGDWAIDEEGNIILRVKFFEDVSPSSAKFIAKKYGNVESGIELLNYITVSVPREKINQLAKEDEVQWIGLVSPPPTTLGGERLFIPAEVAKSIAIEYWNSKYPVRTPETYFSVVNVTSQDDNWLVEIGAYEEVPYEEPKYKGVAGKILISKKSGKVTEQE